MATFHRKASPQTPTSLKLLIKQLTPLLHSIVASVRTQFSPLSHPFDTGTRDETSTVGKKACAAYSTWQATRSSLTENPHDEFCLQTAYMQFVRTFFVCACKAYSLTSHPMSEDSSTLYKDIQDKHAQADPYSNIKATYLQLLTKLYPHACSGHDSCSRHHQEFFDWFTPDPQTVASIAHLLHRYDFSGQGTDTLGRIYNEGFIEHKGRSATGQFYTPPHVVEYMLDTLGLPRSIDHGYKKCQDFLEQTVGDLSCGSGSFLAAAAARKSALLRRLVAAHEVSPGYALQILTNTILGFDLNPFACYLAEINLLLQCLPFLLDKQGQVCRSVERLHIHCADVLEPRAAEFISPGTNQGIDYLVGNPPYVSASESFENLRYREKVSGSGIYQLLHQRWDLFVPFFERNLQLLKPGTGRLGLIVSNGIETEGYAERLRQALCQHYSLLQIDFFPGLRLFQDAAVESTMVFVENCTPGEEHQLVRRRHLQVDCSHFETLAPMLQSTAGELIFRWRFDAPLEQRIREGSVPLCSIAYIGTGIEAQSSEDFDPIIGGKRQKRFTLYDVFLAPSDARPAGYADDGVLGDDIACYYLSRKRFVAYEKFRPQMRGPRHVALFRTPEKLLLGETSGGYYDRNALFANHSVQVVVPWKALEAAGALEERGIQRVYRKSQQVSGFHTDLAPIADWFDLRYILGIINSRFMRQYIASNMHEGTRKGRIYPDVWKRLPIKVAAPERQQEIALLVEEIQQEYKQLSTLAKDESQELVAIIQTNLAEIERLVEAIYREPYGIANELKRC